MGQFYMLCVAVMFSFGGTCVRFISPYFGTEYMSFFRFFFGVMFLLLLKLITRRRFRADFPEMLRKYWPWLVFGAVFKEMAYLTENYALSHGPSYGNIITSPVQTVCVTFISVFAFHEKLTFRKLLCVALCITGVLTISLNGRSLMDFVNSGLLIMILFILSGIGTAGHVLAQKMVSDKMDVLDSNLSIFSIAALLALIPTIPSTAGGALSGIRPPLSCWIAILAFGTITGLGFYLTAKAIPLVPFYMVPLLQNCMVIFAILWGVLFFHDPLTPYVVIGTLMFVTGIIGLQLMNRKKS